MGAKTLKGGLRADNASYITPTKIVIRYIRIAFPCVSSRNLQIWDRIIPYFWLKCIRKCVFAYVVATPLLVMCEKQGRHLHGNALYLPVLDLWAILCYNSTLPYDYKDC